MSNSKEFRAPEVPKVSVGVKEEESHVRMAKFAVGPSDSKRYQYINICPNEHRHELFLVFPDKTTCTMCGKIIEYGSSKMVGKVVDLETPVFMLTQCHNGSTQMPFCGNACMKKSMNIFAEHPESKHMLGCFHCGNVDYENSRLIGVAGMLGNTSVPNVCNNSECIDGFQTWFEQKMTSRTGQPDSAFRCSVCMLAQKKMYRCSKCKIIQYCSTECQRKDWSSHKAKCLGADGMKRQ